MIILANETFNESYAQAATSLRLYGDPVDTGHWQAIRNVPMTKTIELQDVMLRMRMQPTAGSLASAVQPNLPWAENHFMERVGGEPLNPGEQYKNWPYWRGGHKKEDRFSHTYMERFWPKFAGEYAKDRNHRDMLPEHFGIRYRYGDLNDVLDLLYREPHTRQAYLPIWFPEDTGAHHGERVPCTLGYHFMVRDDLLHCFYPIRSCDFLRHFRDDVYLAGRLMQWVLNHLRGRDEAIRKDDHELQGPWSLVNVGNLTMWMGSLHVFQGEESKLDPVLRVAA